MKWQTEAAAGRPKKTEGEATDKEPEAADQEEALQSGKLKERMLDEVMMEELHKMVVEAAPVVVVAVQEDGAEVEIEKMMLMLPWKGRKRKMISCRRN